MEPVVDSSQKRFSPPISARGNDVAQYDLQRSGRHNVPPRLHSSTCKSRGQAPFGTLADEETGGLNVGMMVHAGAVVHFVMHDPGHIVIALGDVA